MPYLQLLTNLSKRKDIPYPEEAGLRATTDGFNAPRTPAWNPPVTQQQLIPVPEKKAFNAANICFVGQNENSAGYKYMLSFAELRRFRDA